MRTDVHPGDLPGEVGRSSIKRDIYSYQEVADAAQAVYNQCSKGPVRVPGWAQIGGFSRILRFPSELL